MGGTKCPARSGSAAACGSLNFMHNSPAFAADFIGGLTRSIAGIEIAITGMEGKWEISQNRSVEDMLA